jgi:UDP-glucose 4-epimerase
MIFQAYGPGQPEHTLIQGAFKEALAGRDFPATAGTQMRDWIFAKDVAKAFSATLNSKTDPGTTVEIGTGNLTTVADVLRKIYRLVGGTGRPLLGAITNRPGEEAHQLADWKRTKDLIDWKAETSLDRGLQEILDALSSGSFQIPDKDA